MFHKTTNLNVPSPNTYKPNPDIALEQTAKWSFGTSSRKNSS